MGRAENALGENAMCEGEEREGVGGLGRGAGAPSGFVDEMRGGEEIREI